MGGGDDYQGLRRFCACRRSSSSPLPVGPLGLDWAQRTMLSARYFNARAGATLDEFPGVALEVDGRRTLAGRARSGRAVILTLQGNTVTLLLVGRRGGRTFRLGQWASARQR